jgi:DNA-binding NtrC family response regulator
MKVDSVVIFITAYGSVKTAVEAMKSGAIYYIEKPFDYGQLKSLALQTLNEQCFRRSITEDKLLAYTLKRAIFNTEKISSDKRENLLPA